MGALNGTATYLRASIAEDPPTQFPSIYEKAIEARRFLPLSPADSHMESSGWTILEDPYNEELPITREFFLFGDVIALTFRMDKLVFPRPLVKHLCRKRILELEAQGEKITRHLRKTVEASIISELKFRILPRTRLVEILWDLSRREVRVFGRGNIVSQHVQDLFQNTFSLELQFSDYGSRAYGLDLAQRARGVLEGLRPHPVFPHS
jgi:hypothetical protein